MLCCFFWKHRHGNGQLPKVYGATYIIYLIYIYIYNIWCTLCIYYIFYIYIVFSMTFLECQKKVLRSVFSWKKNMGLCGSKSPADPTTNDHLNDIRGPRTTKMKILLQLYLTTWMVQEMWEDKGFLKGVEGNYEMYLRFKVVSTTQKYHWNWGKKIWSSRYGKYPIISWVIHPRWCRISSINSMILYEGGYPRHMMLSQIIAWVLVSVPKALMNMEKNPPLMGLECTQDVGFLTRFFAEIWKSDWMGAFKNPTPAAGRWFLEGWLNDQIPGSLTNLVWWDIQTANLCVFRKSTGKIPKELSQEAAKIWSFDPERVFFATKPRGFVFSKTWLVRWWYLVLGGYEGTS